jgi:hypothetical protein
MNAERDAPEMRDEWGLMYPPSVHVGRTFPVREWAEKQLQFAPTAVLVHRQVTEWTRITSPGGSDA